MIRDILCKIGIHSFKYYDKKLPYGGMRYFRKCKCCLLSQKNSQITKSKWKWKSMDMTREDIRELRLRKLLD
jgi:hypothetical protein